jgi:hypothetical protein
MSHRALLVLSLLFFALPARAEEGPWRPHIVKEEVVYETRAVAGSKFLEYRAILTVPRPPALAFETIWKHLQAACRRNVVRFRGARRGVGQSTDARG